jgi:[protein-PII] uridylyltransferase
MPPLPLGCDAPSVMRRIMPDLYFINTPSSQMERHLNLLRRVETTSPLLHCQRAAHGPYSEFTICAFDDAQPGLLSKVCGTLAAHRVSIHTAFVFTTQSHALHAALKEHFGEKESSRSIVLDTLFVSEPYGRSERAPSAALIARIKNDIALVLKGETTVASRLAKTTRSRPAQQFFEIAATPDATGQFTIISLRTQSTVGLLYRVTAALAALELNINVAQINTENGETNDVFYVTSKGEPLDEETRASLPQKLTSLLNNGSY